MTVDRLMFSFEKDSIIQFGFHKLHAVWEYDRQLGPVNAITGSQGAVILSHSAVDELEVRPQQHSTTAPQHHRIA